MTNTHTFQDSNTSHDSIPSTKQTRIGAILVCGAIQCDLSLSVSKQAEAFTNLQQETAKRQTAVKCTTH